jgi:hypothetical protein
MSRSTSKEWIFSFATPNKQQQQQQQQAAAATTVIINGK